MRRVTLAVAFVLCGLTARGGYTYYYNEAFGSLASNWTVNGDMVVAGSNGITNSADDGGGALISTVAVPDGSSNYDVTTTFAFNNLGTFTIYLRASSDTTSNGTSGTYYAVTINNAYSAYSPYNPGPGIQIQKRVGGVLSTLYSAALSSWPQSQFRAIMRWDGQIAVYFDGTLMAAITDTSITSGQPGIGCSYVQLGGFTGVSLGPIDHIGPSINAQSIGTSVFSNHVDIHWTEADDLNGPGIVNYSISRNGTLITDLSTTNFSDTTVAASTSYTYQVSAVDFDLNTASATFTVTTPPSGSIDPRRTGVRPTSTYWGGLGEQIDLLSGNLNYSLPLLRAQGRGGWGIGFNLSYNSENWRQDPGGTWNLGADTGYGYGWKLQAGSLTPYWKDYWDIDHYTFTDATGAQYRLGSYLGGYWTSTESVYLTYDSMNGTLYFPDGSFWTFGSTSAGSEPDSGTMYPTVIEDSNGNQVLVRYQPGVGMTGLNSSARIQDIEDTRAVNDSGTMRTYKFAYDGTNHLTSISNLIGTAEGFGPVAYQTQTLYSPFSGSASYGQTQTLQSLPINGVGLSYSFQQDSTGALTKVTLPYGGYLAWQYANYTYVGSRVQPEVENRYLSKDGVNQTTYPIQRNAGDSSRTVHASAIIADPGDVGQKNWCFNTNTSQFTLGLLASRDDYQYPGPVIKTHNVYTWAQDSNGNASISSAQTTLDPGTHQAVKTVTQTVDLNGNLTATNIFDYTNASQALRRYTTAYMAPYNVSGYPASFYILNRPASGTVGGTIGGVNYPDTTVSLNYYDSYGPVCWVAAGGWDQHERARH